MIQFNLLPDVKLEFIRARRIKRTVVILSAVAGGVAFALFVFMFVAVNVTQQKHLSNLQADITNDNKVLAENTDLSKILTIQNQLSSITALHDQKPITSRIFNDLQRLTPSEANIASVTVDWQAQTIKIDGDADSLLTINTFVDALKFTSAKIIAEGQDDTQAQTIRAFSEVVLASFGITDQSSKDKSTSYSISLKYDPQLYAGDKIVSLEVPDKITSRSETEKPTLFKALPKPESTQGGDE